MSRICYYPAKKCKHKVGGICCINRALLGVCPYNKNIRSTDKGDFVNKKLGDFYGNKKEV